MAGVPPFDRRDAERPRAPRHSPWPYRGKALDPPPPDQEAEVRARLYAKPPPTERTVEIIARIANRPAA